MLHKCLGSVAMKFPILLIMIFFFCFPVFGNPCEKIPSSSCKQACDGGSKDSCTKLARWYQLRGEPSLAITYIKKLCEDDGYLDSCHYLGNLLGQVLPHSYSSATSPSVSIPYYKQACDGGYMVSCLFVGQAKFESGNKTLAAFYFKKASDNGTMRGCYNLGYLKEKSGETVEAERLYKKDCDGGDELACKPKDP